MWKTSLAAVVGFALAIGLVATKSDSQAALNADLSGWRYTDGYWNYYDPDDQAWYYTDGKRWYTYGDNNWSLYNFNKRFGKKAFVREGYVIEKPGKDIVVPRHKVYVP